MQMKKMNNKGLTLIELLAGIGYFSGYYVNSYT